MTPKQLIDKTTISASTIEEVDRDKLVAVLTEYDFARVTNLVTPADMANARQKMREHFDPMQDRATTGESKEEVKRNFQKFSIGSARHGGVDRPRFMRTFYNPLWEEDIYELHGAFKKQCQLRNLLGNKPLNYVTDTEDDGLWTAARIHHFPAGGGFMVGHQDTVLPAFYDTIDLAFYQSLLMITEKGKDYHSGGGFIEMDGERISFEDHCQAGDIIIYNQNTVHGVADIDVDKPFRQDSLNGRMSGLVTFYRVI